MNEPELFSTVLRSLADEIEQRGAVNISCQGSFNPIEDDPKEINGVKWAVYHQGPHRTLHLSWDFVKDENGVPFETSPRRA